MNEDRARPLLGDVIASDKTSLTREMVDEVGEDELIALALKDV